jgi:hypothetical protein
MHNVLIIPIPNFSSSPLNLSPLVSELFSSCLITYLRVLVHYIYRKTNLGLVYTVLCNFSLATIPFTIICTKLIS